MDTLAPRFSLVHLRPIALIAVTMFIAAATSGCVTDFRKRPPAVFGLPVDDARDPISAVWIGHSSVLLRLGDKLIVMDPNFSSHQFLYPRLTPPSIKAQDIPPVDVALISHLHADHFDVTALRTLGTAPTLIFPDGASGYTEGMLGKVELLAPWQSIEANGVKVTAVPALHSGGRFWVDGLWNHAFTGYIIQAAGRTAFFAGDTGYDPSVFKQIGQRFPGIDVAFIPIAPARGGNSAHASPAEALDIFHDVGARFMIPIHFEAFYSSVIPYDEPRRVLDDEANRRGISDQVFALHTGERWLMPASGAPTVTRELPGPKQQMALQSQP